MIILLVGTTGSGKSTVGAELAGRLGWQFVEADDYHPPHNIEKMASGQHLNDAERHAWLQSMREVIDGLLTRKENAVVVASALTQAHRARLRVGDGVTLVYLKGDEGLIRERVRNRRGHFAGEAILDDQFSRLQPPPDAAATVDVSRTPSEVVEEILRQLHL